MKNRLYIEPIARGFRIVSFFLAACGGGSTSRDLSTPTPDTTAFSDPDTAHDTNPVPPPTPAPVPEPEPEPTPETRAEFLCTQVIGFSQTAQWYKGVTDARANPFAAALLRGFQAIIDNGRWQLLWQNGAGVEWWSDPDFEGWNRPLEAPCIQRSVSPDRALLTISGDLGDVVNDPQVWADEIDRAVTTITIKYPDVRQVILQPVVGGPDDAVCNSPRGRGQVRASVNHPVIDQAIALVAQAPSTAVQVLIGFSPTVADCADYGDGKGHFTEAGADRVGRDIGRFYSRF